MTRYRRLWIPIAFLLLAGLLYWGLFQNPRLVPSPLIGKPAPAVEVARLDEPGQRFSPAQMKGQAWLLNVWASWCTTCKQEHPVLVELARSGRVPIVGLNYKDKREAGLELLRKSGDPYRINLFDPEGKAAFDWGVYGTPETFLIDAEGIVRAKHVGPLTMAIFNEKFAPLLPAR
ncbi:MAG: DsbE family thiol:disulfide interchange protein [Casimicrobiaceae bacterium]|nr:DsbE family thiol:disulfide interchange protein [Casimicrobiaceae bacterium]MCX8097455.1 DsbE family thiol:disulfide interchange protein [Casimicrobiaceae bacterium]MDW8311173.1 DsbE family thiol:disulfide interchange protein [Burkholderiales bacterium]